MGSAGGEIASTFDSPDKLKLGTCKLIEEIMIGEDKLIHFSGVEMGEACTIVLRGASEHPRWSLSCHDDCYWSLLATCMLKVLAGLLRSSKVKSVCQM